MTQNYNNINFFNRENYNALCAKVGKCVKKGVPNADKLLESLEERCSAFLDYVNTVDMGETRIIIAHNRLEGEDLRDALQTIDRLRKCYHDVACNSCSIINRMAAANGIGPVFTGDSTDRLQVADFCLEFTIEIFKNRKK